MNKNRFLELLKAPDRASEADYVELEDIVKKYPYFQAGHSVLAQTSRLLKSPNPNKKLTTASLYAISRKHFKLYMQGLLKFEATPQKIEPQSTSLPLSPNAARQKDVSDLTLPKEKHDDLIEEVYKNLEKWKSSRSNYLNYEKEHPEEIVIEEPFESNIEGIDNHSAPPEPINSTKASDPNPAEGMDQLTQLKRKLAEELEYEEKSIDQALSKSIAVQTKKESVNKKMSDPLVISTEEMTAMIEADLNQPSDENAGEKLDHVETRDKTKQTHNETAPNNEDYTKGMEHAPLPNTELSVEETLSPKPNDSKKPQTHSKDKKYRLSTLKVDTKFSKPKAPLKQRAKPPTHTPEEESSDAEKKK